MQTIQNIKLIFCTTLKVVHLDLKSRSSGLWRRIMLR